MKKTFIAIALTLGFAASANPDWNTVAGLTNFSDDDVSLNAITLGAGYEFSSSHSTFSFMPELRLGFGVGDDNISGGKVEIERYIGISLRGIYQASDTVYLYAQPSYVNLKLKASGSGQSVSADEWEFGFGGGVGYKTTANLSLELSYERFDNTDAITAGLRYAF
jgi:opacity protein-like surface antigen